MRFSAQRVIGLSLMVIIVLSANAGGSALTGAPSAGQPSQSVSDGTLKVTSTLTLENVTVTDSKGQPVRGLTQADFNVKEDGKPQQIRSFEEYGAAKMPALAALPPNVYSNRPLVAADAGAVNILMFDNVSTGLVNGLQMSPDYFIYSRQQAAKYLETMPPGTEVAVLDLADGLRVAQAFTPDKELLRAAVNSIPTTMVSRTYLPTVGPPPPIDQACLVANRQSELTVDALNQAVAFVSGIKGRKNLIWFTPGIPWVTDYPRFSRVGCLRDYSRELHKAYDLLTAAQVALYPVDPRGVGVSPLSPDFESLEDLAKATGGIPYMGRNDLDAAVGEAITTGSDYYSIAYVPPPTKYDGQHHTIRVTVDRPGLHLSYREGYTSDDPAHPIKAAEKQDAVAEPVGSRKALAISMGREAPTLSDLQFDVRVEPDAKPSVPPVIGMLDPKLKNKPLTRYDFHYMIPAGYVTIANAPEGGHQSALILDVAAFDGDGKLLTSISQPASLPLTTEAYQRMPSVTLRCVQQVDLPPGQIFVRVGILDTASNKIGTLDIPLKVAAAN